MYKNLTQLSQVQEESDDDEGAEGTILDKYLMTSEAMDEKIDSERQNLLNTNNRVPKQSMKIDPRKSLVNLSTVFQ